MVKKQLYAENAKNNIGHRKNYVRCRKNYIRHNSNYIRPFFIAFKHLKDNLLQHRTYFYANHWKSKYSAKHATESQFSSSSTKKRPHTLVGFHLWCADVYTVVFGSEQFQLAFSCFFDRNAHRVLFLLLMLRPQTLVKAVQFGYIGGRGARVHKFFGNYCRL